jgi:hypothetical protein
VLLAPAGASEAQWIREFDSSSHIAQDDPQPPADSTVDDQSGVPTALNPCQLVTSSEASSLAGATYANGTATTNSGGGMTCVYGSQTTNVFMVTVAQATDADTAQAEWSQEEAKAQSYMFTNVPQGVSVNFNITDLSGLSGADRAAVGQGDGSYAGRSINGSACYLLKGATFVAFSDLLLNQPAPTNDALESEAQTVLGRLP